MQNLIHSSILQFKNQVPFYTADTCEFFDNDNFLFYFAFEVLSS